MFYFEDCRKEREWPKSFMISRGNCELCREHADCYDVPSKHLPDPKPRTPHYPEHKKLSDVEDKSQAIGEFLDWLLNQRKSAIYKYTEAGDNEEPQWINPETGEGVEHDLENELNRKIKRNPSYESWEADFRMDYTSIEDLLAEYFGIDQNKLEEEKRQMLSSLRS